MLREIKESLESFGYPVSYGMKTEDLNENEPWNYFVFRRYTFQKSNSLSFKRLVMVTFVHDAFIEEDFEMKIIDQLEKIKGLKHSGQADIYNYSTKGDTDYLVESITMFFTESGKICP